MFLIAITTLAESCRPVNFILVFHSFAYWALAKELWIFRCYFCSRIASRLLNHWIWWLFWWLTFSFFVRVDLCELAIPKHLTLFDLAGVAGEIAYALAGLLGEFSFVAAYLTALEACWWLKLVALALLFWRCHESWQSKMEKRRYRQWCELVGAGHNIWRCFLPSLDGRNLFLLAAVGALVG